MTTIFQERHSGMDPVMDLSLPSMVLDTRFPASMTNLRIIELKRCTSRVKAIDNSRLVALNYCSYNN